MPSDELVKSYIKYKFKKAKFELTIKRIKTFLNMDIVNGPSHLICSLKIIELEKKLFSLLLERGTEVRIPNTLLQTRYPQSFRYYDPIINIIKIHFSGINNDFSKLKKSISYAFDQKFQANSFFFKKNDDNH